MVNKILTRAGIRYRETRFPSPPAAETYGVYTDDVTADGPDGINAIFTHDVTVELYEPKPDPKAEAALESSLDTAGLKWTKQARYWLPEEQRYQVIYEFTYYEKRRIKNG